MQISGKDIKGQGFRTMTRENSLEKKLEELGQAIGSQDSIVENIMTRIQGSGDEQSGRNDESSKQPKVK